MSDDGGGANSVSLATLAKTAAAIERGVEILSPEGELSHNAKVNNRSVWRYSIALYLSDLAKYLSDQQDLPPEVVAPLLLISGQIHELEQWGSIPPLFATDGRPFDLSKPIGRLHAEGYAVGCVTYLHDTVGLRIMDACKAVASLFSHLGHAGRTAEGKVGDSGRLSAKTLHIWHGELLSKPADAGIGWTIRWGAKLSAMEALREAEISEPTANWPQQEARTKLAERMSNIAVGALVGSPSSPWRFEPKF